MKRPRLAVLLLAVVVVQLIIFLGHWLMYKTVVFAFELNDWQVRTWYSSLFLVLSLVFMTAQISVNIARSRFLDIFYLLASIWLGTAHIFLLACSVFWATAAIVFHFETHMVWWPFATSLFAFIVFTDGYAIWNGFRARVTRYDIALPNLPEAWRGRTIVMASDTHFGNIRRSQSAEKLVRMANAENPDLVLIPGDFFDGPLADYGALAAPLRGIRSRFGTYFIEGNHEEFKDPAPYLAALRAAGVKVLDREMADVEGLQLLGLKYAGSEQAKELQVALASIPFDRNRPSILMKHSPSARRVVAAAGISLMVSGHTHKGQMWPYNLFARQLFGKAVYGHTSKNGLQTITSSGFGTWGPPQRLGTKSELVVIKLS